MGQSSRADTSAQHQNADLPNKAKDFIILCPATAENSGALEALYALYYLPCNYKLMISATGAKSKAIYDRMRKLVRKESFTDRVTFSEVAGLPEMASPFSCVDMVVYGNSDPIFTKGATQSIVVFDVASKLSNTAGQHNFAVATTAPEALASAILTVARRQKPVTT